jgi:hypothetical protein
MALKIGSTAMAERQVLLDTIFVSGMHRGGATEIAPALGVLALGQVAFAGAGTQNFAGGGDLKPLGGGLFGFDAFGATHKLNLSQKRARNLGRLPGLCKPLFRLIELGTRPRGYNPAPSRLIMPQPGTGIPCTRVFAIIGPISMLYRADIRENIRTTLYYSIHKITLFFVLTESA